MTAAMLVLEPIFEADLRPNSTRTAPGAMPNRRWSRWKSCRSGALREACGLPGFLQIGLARRQPVLCRCALALRAVSVATRVVRDLAVGAVLAARDMAAERRRAAVLDRRHHLELAEADMAGISPAPCRPVAAEDVRDFQRWTRHEGSRVRRAVRPFRP